MAKCKHKESCGYEVCLDDCCPEFEAAVETNADRIRAMSDEELAQWLNSFGGDLFCLNKKECVELVDADKDIPAERCQRCVMDWLQQPAEDRKDGKK